MTTLAITLGDPRGIGPEIVAKALNDARIKALDASFVVFGPTGTEVAVTESVGEWTPDSDIAIAGALSGRAIENAVAAVRAGRADALITAPIDKAALYAGGYDFPGHTELLASLAGVPTTMMLASSALRVVLATTHIALRDVPAAVTFDTIVSAANAARKGLSHWFGLASPRLALCALNPHGGDGGRFGDEDQRVLAPAAIAARIEGPFPADTVFVRALRGEFDAVIAPYHDVGMTAIKVASFGSGVNITLGLPFPRTSPDHGTALDIAGRGVASAESIIAAIITAAEMSRRVSHKQSGPGT